MCQDGDVLGLTRNVSPLSSIFVMLIVSIPCPSGYRRMAVIAGIGTREYYRSSGSQLVDSYMVKDLTVWGLHAGRADLLADQPTRIVIECQDTQQAAAALLLPLPPKAPHKRRKETQGNKKGRVTGKTGVEATMSTRGGTAALHETEEKAKAFLMEYTSSIEEIDVPSLLNKLKDSETSRTEAEEPPIMFTDKDTFSEHCKLYAALQRQQLIARTTCWPLQCYLVPWLYGEKVTAPERRRLLLATSAATAGAACAAVWLLWVFARRRQ